MIEGEVVLPPDAPLSFYGPGELAWTLAIRLKIAWWFDWTRELDLHVLPATMQLPARRAPARLEVEES